MQLSEIEFLQGLFEKIATQEERQETDMLLEQGQKEKTITIMQESVKNAWEEIMDNRPLRTSLSVFQGKRSKQIIKLSCVNCESESVFVQIQ